MQNIKKYDIIEKQLAQGLNTAEKKGRETNNMDEHSKLKGKRAIKKSAMQTLQREGFKIRHRACVRYKKVTPTKRVCFFVGHKVGEPEYGFTIGIVCYMKDSTGTWYRYQENEIQG